MNEDTRIIHSVPVDKLTGAISVPIYQTSTFVQEAPGEHKGFDYARTRNPTRQALEDLLAVLEEGTTGLAFASGLAAIDAVLKLLRSGDEVVAVDDIYGGTFRLFTHVYEKFGISVKYIDTSDIDEVQRAVSSKTKLVWIESPTNPTLKVSDIQAVAAIAQQAKALLVVDNTFASPILQKPLALGADIVVHSATKYLAGHSDLIAGCVIVKNAELAERLKFIQNASGGILGPFDAWLTIRGIETLALRVRRQCASALEVARYLETSKAVGRVYYPGLETHHNHLAAKRQQQGLFGGIVSFSLANDSLDDARALVSTTKLFQLAESLGGVKSLICQPSLMTHKSIPADVRKRAGVLDSLIRLSIGLEDPEDLIADLERVLFS